MSTATEAERGFSPRVALQKVGTSLSNMVMPNIPALIAWGILTAFFIPDGWTPNEPLASAVGPMIHYLLPLLIANTGGRMIYEARGAVVGVIATMGVIAGSDWLIAQENAAELERWLAAGNAESAFEALPEVHMFIGAMIIAPLTAWLMQKLDRLWQDHIPAGFEMLVNMFSAGIFGFVMLVAGFFGLAPLVNGLMTLLANGVAGLVNAGLLPLVSLLIEPAKVFFLNNAINHGVLTPLGISEAERGEDPVIDGVVEEEDLGRLDQQRHQGQQPGVDQAGDAVGQQGHQAVDQRGEAEESGHQHHEAEDAGREHVHQHLEAGRDVVLPQPVQLLHQPGGGRGDDHRPDEHVHLGQGLEGGLGVARGEPSLELGGVLLRDQPVRAGDHAHGGDHAHHGAARLVDHAAAGVGDQQRQQVVDHRADGAGQRLVRRPAIGDEEGGQDAPGDQRRDVRHHHVRQGGADLLQRHTRAEPALGLSSCAHDVSSSTVGGTGDPVERLGAPGGTLRPVGAAPQESAPSAYGQSKPEMREPPTTHGRTSCSWCAARQRRKARNVSTSTAVQEIATMIPCSRLESAMKAPIATRESWPGNEDTMVAIRKSRLGTASAPLP